MDNPAILVYQLANQDKDEGDCYQYWNARWDLWTRSERADWADWVLERGRWEGKFENE